MKVLQVKFIFCRCLQDEGFELFHKISCNEDVQGDKCIDKVGSKLTILIFIYSQFNLCHLNDTVRLEEASIVHFRPN